MVRSPPNQAAALVAGPSGITVRELAKQTGTDIKSWTEPGTTPDGKDLGPVRVFFVQASADETAFPS